MSRLLALSHASLRARRPVLIAARLSGLLALKRQRTHLSQLDSKALATIASTVRLDDVIATGADIVAGKVRGRIVVEVA